MPLCSGVEPRVLTIAGVDPTAGAGLGSDLRVAAVHGCVGLPIVAALTVQNRRGFARVQPTDPGLLWEMVDAALDDAPIGAIKTGLLGDAGTVDALSRLLEDSRVTEVPWVVDPVASATAGGYAAADPLLRAYAAWFGSRIVWTPNSGELLRLVSSAPRLADGEGVEAAASVVAGAQGAVLCTGGDDDGDPIEDRLWANGQWTTYRHPRIAGLGPVHGTGCALATALACRLAAGDPLEGACRGAIDYVSACLAATEPSRDGLPVPLRIESPR